MGNSDSSTLFRDCINKLLNQEVPPEEHEFWCIILSLDFSSEDLARTFPFTDVYKMHSSQYYNFISLLELCLRTLAIPVSDQASIQAMSNTVKILTRLLPVSIQDPYMEEFWWGEQHRAVSLLANVTQLMFTPTYCVSGHSSRKQDDPTVKQLWYKGIKSAQKSSSSQAMDNRRIDLLKLILVCISDTVYVDIDASPWQWILCSKALPCANHFFYNLVNCLFAFDSIGKWNIPYAAYINISNKETITKYALQILPILLLFRPKLVRRNPAADYLCEVMGEEESVLKNEFSAKMNMMDEEFVTMTCKGISSKLEVIAIEGDTYFPHSQKPLGCAEEIVIFLWTCIEIIDDFSQLFVQTVTPKQVVLPLIKYIFKKAEDPNYKPATYLCSYILHILSQDRDFCLSLNQAFESSFPFDIPIFAGNYSDFFILAVTSLYLKDMHLNDLFLTLANTAPFIRSCGAESSLNLLKALDKSIKEWNLPVMYYLMDTFNSIVQYSWPAASDLVYQILVHKNSFMKIEEHFNSEICESDPNAVHSSVLNSHVSIPSIEEEHKEEVVESDTMNWVSNWRTKFHFDTFCIIIKEVMAIVEELRHKDRHLDSENIKTAIRDTTLVGLLPLQTGFIPKKKNVTEDEKKWILNSIWTLFYFGHSLPLLDPSKSSCLVFNN